jgi:hypothetical protein
MIGIELVRNRQTKERAASERDAVITREQAETAVGILEDALTEISNS